MYYLAAQKIVYVDIALVNYERRNAGSITTNFRPKNLEACEAFREKIHLIWSRPELQEIDKKACNNYCYVLLDRIALCEASFPDCEALRDSIRCAYEDYEKLKEHGIDECYIVKLDALFEKYKNVLPIEEAKEC